LQFEPDILFNRYSERLTATVRAGKIRYAEGSDNPKDICLALKKAVTRGVVGWTCPIRQTLEPSTLQPIVRLKLSTTSRKTVKCSVIFSHFRGLNNRGKPKKGFSLDSE